MNKKTKNALGGIATSFLGLVLIIIAQSDHKLLGVAGMILFLGGYAVVGGTIIFYMIQCMRRRSVRPYEYAVVCVGFVLGLLVWLLSPILTGDSEPWDVPSYYLMAMLISGLVCGIIARRCWVFSAAAITLGQFPAANWGLSMFFPISLISLILGGLPALVGAATSSTIVTITLKLFNQNKPHNQRVDLTR